MDREFRSRDAHLLEDHSTDFDRGSWNLNLISSSIAAACITGVVTLVLARYLSRKFKEIGITGIDVHKPQKPVTAEMGGVSILLGVAVGSTALYLLDPAFPRVLFAGLITVLIIGGVGVLDDFIALRQRFKPLVIALASIPIAITLLGTTDVPFPLIGSIPFGLLYPLVVVPLGITTCANLTNMLAGFNGLESGCAVIAIGTLTLLAGIKGSGAGETLGILLLTGYLAFLVLNWYPAKIFPGDTGTLMAGAAIATIGLVSGLVFAAVVVTLPAAFDFTLKMLKKNPFSARKIFGDTTVTVEGILVAPAYPALSHAFMSLAPQSERSLVLSMLAMESVYGLLAIAITLLL